jgi:hypothetical protein
VKSYAALNACVKYYKEQRRIRMTTPEEIEALLQPYGLSLKERPVPTDNYAYKKSDRRKAFQMAKEWQGSHYDVFNPENAEVHLVTNALAMCV